jgi:hypothetical protein
MTNKVPLPALLLGLAGLIPPAILTGVALFDLGLFAPSTPGFVRSYGAIILSFLGGSWWAFACREERPSRLLLGIAVLPPLAGWTAIFWFYPPEALFGLALLLLGSLAVDALLVRRRLAPSWWMGLRVPLSVGLALCSGLSGWALLG